MALVPFPSVESGPFTPLMFPGGVLNPTLGGTEEVLERNSRLGAMVEFPMQRHADYVDIYGFLADMDGWTRLTAVPFTHYREHVGNGSGSPTVSGAVAEGATQIASTGWGGSDPRIARGGMITISTSIGGVSVPRAYMLRRDANGTTPTLEIWPPVKDALAGGEAIEYAPNEGTLTYMRSAMRLTRPGDPAGQTLLVGGAPSRQLMRGLAIELIESVRADYTA